MGSAVNKVVKEVKRAGDRVGREVSRSADKVGREVNRVADSATREVSRSADKVGREVHRFESSGLGRAVLDATSLGMYGSVRSIFKAGKAVTSGNSLDIFNSITDTAFSGTTFHVDKAFGSDAADTYRTVGNVTAGIVATPFTGGASLAIASAVEGGRQLGKGTQDRKAEIAEQRQAQAAYEAKQKRLNSQAEFINSIYSQGSQAIQSNAFYNTYQRYGHSSATNVATYGYF